jgi:hypothetical protein
LSADPKRDAPFGTAEHNTGFIIMAVRRGEDTKTPLIVALVVFVVLTIGLGIATYFGFSEQQKLIDAEKAAKKDAAAKAESRNWHKFQNVLLKSYIGHRLDKADQEHLISQWKAYEENRLGTEKDDNRADFDTLAKQLNQPGLLGWDNTKKQPAKTFLELVKEKDQAIADLSKQLAQAKQESQRAQTDLANAKKSAEETEKNLNEQLQKTKKDMADLVNVYEAKYKEYFAAVEKLHNEVDDTKRREDKTKDETSRQLAKMKKDLTDTKTQLDNERKKLSPPDVIDLEKPKGKIIDIDRGGQVVYLDLGTADNVKPQLTFSIYGAGANLKGTQRKGAVEVTNVLGPHLAKARVTELSNPNLDPLVRGDLLYNPAWNPTVRQHVAIAGLVDLTGDATDDTPAFIRGLERLGIVVDAYIDLKDLKQKGPGLTLQTQYLVFGDEPRFNEAGVLNQTDIITSRKVELNKKMSEMREEATRLGIPIIPYRRFLTLVGYPTPPTLTTRESPSSLLDSATLGSGTKSETPDDKSRKDKESPPDRDR